MKILLLRKPPFFGLLVLGLIFGSLLAYALASGKFPVLRKGARLMVNVLRSEDPCLFLYWVRVSAIYCVGMCWFSLVRLNLVEEIFHTLAAGPGPGQTRFGDSWSFRAKSMFSLFIITVLIVCYVVTFA